MHSLHLFKSRSRWPCSLFRSKMHEGFCSLIKFEVRWLGADKEKGGDNYLEKSEDSSKRQDISAKK